MRNYAFHLKRTLAKMRLNQRKKQEEQEEEEEAKSTFVGNPNFCPICRLTYRAPRAKHVASESHIAMKKFLKPYCRLCSIDFSTPMMFESHLCSLGHLKKKAYEDSKKGGDDSGDERNVDMDKFMILDAVGDDDNAEGGSDDKDDSKKVINVGSEFVRKCEAQFCDLCRTYLPHQEEPERAVVIHCRTRLHLNRLIQHKDKAKRKEAERLQRKKGEKDGQEKKKTSESMESDTDKSLKAENESLEDQDGIEEKLWADMDKDLGDILREVGPGNKSSDEDDDSRAGGGRYDRFRNSEKGSAKESKSEADQENSTLEEKMETDAPEKEENRENENAESTNTD